MDEFVRAARGYDRGGKVQGMGKPAFSDRVGWDAVQKLINLRPPGASGGTRPTTRPHIFRMNLAALVIPGVITVVCVLVGLMTLHEYCLGEPGDGNDGTVPRCFLNTDAASRALYAAKYGESKEQQVTLSYAKFAAISFYGASLLTTLATLPHNNGPLKLSLIFYHILICLWSTAYYTMDFLGYMPQVRSERDGMIEYSVMRVLAVWPVTSTLMISKVAILCIMTRHLGEVDSGGVSLLGFDDMNEDDDLDTAVKFRGESMRGGLHNAVGESDGPAGGLRHAGNNRQSVVDGGVADEPPNATGHEANKWLRTFDRIAGKFTGRAEMSAKLSQELGQEGSLMAASLDVWKASLVNNLMLLAGAFGLISDMYWVRVLSIGVSCLLFIGLMSLFRKLFQFVVKRVQHPQDRRSLQVLETLTYVTWTLFPIIQIARDVGYIDTATQFLMMTAADIVAKMMYSINLIFSNFWLMNNADGLMRLDEGLFTDALELSRYSQLAATTLEKAKREAESVSALHRAFVANISHELRTPLNSIIAFNSLLLEDDTLTEPQREFVSSAIVSAEALLGIIGQILDFAKLESGSGMHQELVIESFDINEMVNELVDIVGHQANKNQVELVLDVAPELDGLNVRGDKFRLRQALINVINNSIKFTREGGEVRLRVTVLPDHDPVARRISRISYDDIARGVGRGQSWTMGLALNEHADHGDDNDDVDANDDNDVRVATACNTGNNVTVENDFLAPHAPRVVVAFEVCDNGIGIARDKLKLIFMPFGQASVSSTREYGGTGLGLAITNNIVQSVGGTITCSSELNAGTTMVLSVPLEVRNRMDTQRNRQLDPETRVLSVIAKRSLADAIGHAATCAGAATHVYIEAGARFPHTEHQRKLWAAEVATAIFRAQSRSEGCAVLVMEECFLAPLWTEWCRMFRDSPSMPNMPPIVLIVGKKMQVKDILRNEKELRRSSRGSGGLRQDSFGGFSGLGGSHTDLQTLERREEGWRALIECVVQLIRPVKPTLLREALKSAEVMLHQEQARAAAAAAAGARVGSPHSPARAPPSRQPSARGLGRSGAGGDAVAAAALVSPGRVTRSASRRLAASASQQDGSRELGEDPVNSGLRHRSSQRIRVGGNPSRRDPNVPPLPERGWIQPRGAAAHAPPAQVTARPTRSRQSGGSIASFVTAGDELMFRHGGHVLIVEDNPMNQKVAKVVVKHCGMTADVANNGQEAVDILRSGGLYDVVLMDIQMPVMDGLEATQRIREMEADGTIASGNYIVATSANATAENHREGYEAGMDEYITKPIYPTKLKELLAKPKRMQTALELEEAGDGEVTSLVGRKGSG